MQGVVLHTTVLVVVLLPIIVSRADFQQALCRQIGAKGKDACSRETCGQMVNHVCGAHVSSLDLIGVIGNGLCKSDRAIINAGSKNVRWRSAERELRINENGSYFFSNASIFVISSNPGKEF